ncbi:uncharacterized protein LOC123517786 [Portunus trituberculatus]|nr:uncharacterized protein LOC123517786 [Portunus trituberculatus]
MCEGYVLSSWEVVDVNRENGSVKLRPVWTKCPEDYGPIVAGVFLSLVFVVAFLLNMMVVVTVATSYTLKRYLYCHLLVNLCVTCLVDCFLNLSVAIVYVTTAPWRLGYAVSYVNGFTMNMMNSEMAFVVVLVAGDRMAAARRNTAFLSMKKYKMWLAVSLTWVVSALLASPLLLGHVLSMPYRNRYSCSVADPQDQYYLIAHLVLVVAAPTVALMVMAILVGRTFHRERRKQRRVKNSQTLSYFDQILMTPYFRNEFYPTLAAGGVVCGYLLFWLPFTTLTTISPMVTDHWKNDTSQENTDDPSTLFVPSLRVMTQARAMLDQGKLHSLNNTESQIGSNMATNLTVEDTLISEVVRSPVFDTVAIWLRFLFSVLAPAVVFLTLKEVRFKCENLIFCCRPSSVDAASPKTSRPLYANTQRSQGGKDTAKSNKKNKNSNKDTINFKTPILFSTSDGLHIRTVEETFQEVVNKPLGAFPWSANTEQEPKFVYSLCDLVVGYEDLTDFDGQFHIDDNYDYDRDPEAAGLGEENSVVVGAHRAAMGQKPLPRPPVEEEEIPEEQGSLKVDYRPPTPPRVQVVGNDPAVIVGETLENNGRNGKGRKVVRFAQVISQEIPRPSSSQSNALNSSANSSRSSDSGIIADSETEASNGPQRLKPRRILPEARSLPKTKVSRKPPAAPKKTRKPGPAGGGAGRGSRRPMVSTRVKGIKSRHLQAQARSPSVPRRFSKPSDVPRR